jgi:RHS repeat-associated protein
VQLAYSYDAVGRRISKATNGGTPMQYLYDAANAVQETQGSNINAILTGLGVDERFARTDVTGRTYFLTDALNSTIALTDPTGAIREQYSYDPYGNVTPSDTTTGFTNPYQYTGREADTPSLYYYRARYYSPQLPGFISEDPSEFAGGQLSFYAYVAGDPITLIDQLGLAQRLGYTTVMPGPGQNTNQDPWQIQWTLSEPSPAGGWIVQQNTITLPDGSQTTYWEAWQVAPNATETTQAAAMSGSGQVPVDDTFDVEPASANVHFHASARFYEGLKLPCDFVPHSNPYAQALPATSTNPHLPLNGATPPVVRNWSPH